MEAIRAGHTIEKIFLQKNLRAPLFKALCDLMVAHEIPFSYVPVEKLKRLTSGNHQGVVALIAPIAFARLEVVVEAAFEKGKLPLLVLLDGVTDVHNLGAIARTALCMGVDALVLPTHGSASITATAMKTSAGALAVLPVCRVTHLHDVLCYLQESGFTIVACHERGKRSLYQIDLKLPVALIFGGEEKGIAPKHLSYAVHHIRIPIEGPIASLNVSVAVGMILYEVFRQRNV